MSVAAPSATPPRIPRRRSRGASHTAAASTASSTSVAAIQFARRNDSYRALRSRCSRGKTAAGSTAGRSSPAGTAVCHSAAAAAHHAAATAPIAQNLAVRIAVISDVHANLYALEAVLEAVDADPPDEIWCLGDTVGYGPRPNECCALVRERSALVLVGNHDLVAIGLGGVGLEDFNPEAGAALFWTAEQLTPESRKFLASLAPQATRADVSLFHGSPVDPVWDYVLTDPGAAEALALTPTPLVLVGHSHAALALLLANEALQGGLATAGLEADLAAGRWLLNPGSVGQPRDGDARAAFLRLDLDAKRARFERVPYPVERTQAEIRERGLPDSLAERLAHGV